MFKKNICLIITVLAVVIYVFAQRLILTENNTGNAPEIVFDESIMSISVSDKENKLLEGVYASDKEDGDLSDRVVVERISPFNANLTRTVYYYVFDNDDNVSTASRMIQYTNYTPPVFSITDQLKGDSYSFNTLTSKVMAVSSVDGDISSKVVVKNVDLADNRNIKVKLAASDSTNTSSYLDVIYHLEADLPIEIFLKNYLIYLKQGEQFDYRNHIKLIIERNEDISEYIKDVKIDIPEMNKPGTYEVVYSIEKINGNTGKTILNVVVE